MRIRARRVWRGLTIAGLFAGLYAWRVEPYWIEVTRHTVSLPTAPLRIVLLSDLHTGGPGALERRTVALTGAERPDLIVIAGDTLRNGGPYPIAEDERAAVRTVLSEL